MFGYPSPNPVIRADQERRIAAATIMGVLASAGRPVEINPGELTIRPKHIHCHTKVRRLLAEAIYDESFSRVMAGEFFHTTGVEGFQGIAQSGELRLYTLRKRMECAIEASFTISRPSKGGAAPMSNANILKLSVPGRLCSR